MSPNALLPKEYTAIHLAFAAGQGSSYVFSAWPNLSNFQWPLSYSQASLSRIRRLHQDTHILSPKQWFFSALCPFESNIFTSKGAIQRHNMEVRHISKRSFLTLANYALCLERQRSSSRARRGYTRERQRSSSRARRGFTRPLLHADFNWKNDIFQRLLSFGLQQNDTAPRHAHRQPNSINGIRGVQGSCWLHCLCQRS